MFRPGMSGLLADFGSRAFGIDDPQDRRALELIEEIVRAEMATGPAGTEPSEPFQLRQLAPWLEAYRFHQQHRWVIPLGLGTLLAGLLYGVFYLGTQAGRS